MLRPALRGDRLLRRLLAEARTDYTSAARQGLAGRTVQIQYAARLDDIVLHLVREAAAGLDTTVAACAIGGYGRRTLCLHSDIDLLIVFGGPIAGDEEAFLNAVLQPLWDLGLRVGHHVREVDELEVLDAGNPELLLALADVRLLMGDVRLFDAVVHQVPLPGSPRGRQAVDALVELADARHASFNDTLYQLEPDVKQAPGGLRDIAAVRLLRTLGRDAFGRTAGVDADLDAAEELLLRVRSALHVESGRDTNVLTHERQEQVAGILGMPGADTHERVEALMTSYFHHARVVARAFGRARAAVAPAPAPPAIPDVPPGLTVAADGIHFTGDGPTAPQPSLWLAAFQTAIAAGRPLSDEAHRSIATHVGRYPTEYFVATASDRERLLALLTPRPGLAAQLADMLECGLLTAIFPEFERIHCRVIRDFYHKYTVDEHTLLAIRNVESLAAGGQPSRGRFMSLLAELHAPELLTLALLYHDVGKWRGDRHVDESLALADPMLTRLQLAPEARHTVELLITEHLAMSRLAFQRDLDDPDTAAECAAIVGNEHVLKMLTLMTLADVGAVAPGTLTPWKEDLLWRLYVDTYNHLTLDYADQVIRRDEADTAGVVAGRPADIADAELQAFLDGLPRRYLSVFGAADVYRHVRLARDLGPDELHLSLDRRADIWELAVAARDRRYLFSNICGVLAHFGMNIHRGQAMTAPSGLVLDVVAFSDGEGFLAHNAGAAEEMRRVLQDVVAGVRHIPTLLRGRRHSVFNRRPRGTVSGHVQLDNARSARYTVLEIVAADAPGLLYRISRAISDQGCAIDLVLITTEGRKAIDVLHVTKRGRKLDDSEQVALTDRLRDILRTDPDTHTGEPA